MSTVTKITIGRLFNLGNYEHKRYEIEISIPAGESAADALTGVERILGALKPKCPIDVSELYELKRRAAWKAKDWANWWGRGDRDAAKCAQDNAESLEKLKSVHNEWNAHQIKVRALLDDLGAASQFKDAKQDWEKDVEF